MRRGPKPAKSKEATPPIARKSPRGDGAKVRDLEKRLAEALRDKAAAQEQLQTRDTELVQARQQLKVAHVQATESLEQQAATSEILRVIAGSPTDPQPVFDAILKRAATLCEAQLGHLWLDEGGEQFRLGAGYGSRPDHLQWLQQGLHRIGQPFFRESGPWRVGQILDVRDTEPYRRGEPLWIRTADHEGMRTLLGVPLVKDGRLVGSIAVYRREVQPFTDQQTALVQTFADQAVIAIENVRLFRQLEARNRDLTSTSAILQVISSSPTDAQPVFDAIAQSALRLCEGSFSNVIRYDGDLLHHVAGAHITPAGADVLRQVFPLRPSRATLSGRVVLDRVVVHVRDMQTDPDYMRTLAEAMRVGSGLAVPMLREGQAVGCIAVGRFDVRPFTDEQIALLQTFADQAVIAIENVRLFKELETRNRDITEALEQQTATAEVLRVISRSTFELQPVLDTLIENAARLCGARRGVIFRRDGDTYYGVAFYNTSPDTIDFVRAHPISPGRDTITARVALARRTIHVADVQADPEYGYVLRDEEPIRTELGIPMFRDDEIVGVIILFKVVVEPFTDKQIELVETFADQAVIAIENVRLFTELQERNRAVTQAHAQVSEALEQQTATSEILRVIASSPTDLQPVMDAV